MEADGLKIATPSETQQTFMAAQATAARGMKPSRLTPCTAETLTEIRSTTHANESWLKNEYPKQQKQDGYAAQEITLPKQLREDFTICRLASRAPMGRRESPHGNTI